MGLPLHLRSQKTFKAIGDVCGGWVKTKEETQLSNHLKWARIKVRGDGRDTPKNVKVKSGGALYVKEIWSEASMRVVVGEKSNFGCPNSFKQWFFAEEPKGKEVSAFKDSGQSTEVGPHAHVGTHGKPREHKMRVFGPIL